MSDKGKIRVSSEINSSEIKSSEINSDEIKSGESNSSESNSSDKGKNSAAVAIRFCLSPCGTGVCRLAATCNMVLSGNVPRAAKSAATALGGD